MTTIDDTLQERGSRYGTFEGHAEITQALKKILTRGRSWSKCSDSQKESLEMIAHKMGRIVNGDPNYVDSWTDIGGYSRLIERQLEGENL